MWRTRAYQQGLPKQKETCHCELHSPKLCLYLGPGIHQHAKKEDKLKRALCSYPKLYDTDGQRGREYHGFPVGFMGFYIYYSSFSRAHSKKKIMQISEKMVEIFRF